MTDLYLILHKVRGVPALDVASRLMIGDEEGWIIPTSGHRAYPCAMWEIPSDRIDQYALERFDELPDHYPIIKEKPQKLSLESLGFSPPAIQMRRRI